MNTLEQKHEIMEKAIDALGTSTKTLIKKHIIEWEMSPQSTQSTADAILTLKLKESVLKYAVEIKMTLTPTSLGILANRLRAQRNKWILIAHYIPAHFAMILREMEIPFIDTVGNAYINEPPIYLQIQGNRPATAGVNRLAEKGMLGRVGLRVVFALLCNNRIANDPFRKIAYQSGVALGTVDRVFKDLRNRNYINDTDHSNRKLTRKGELISWWVNAYAEKLAPKQIIGRYETDDYELLQRADLTKFDAQWGGEMAAGKLSNYLKPEVFTIYAHKPVDSLILGLKLRENPYGKIEVRERFWRFDYKLAEKNLVHPILVYADLLATGDPRNIEAARIIYEALIAHGN